MTACWCPHPPTAGAFSILVWHWMADASGAQRVGGSHGCGCVSEMCGSLGRDAPARRTCLRECGSVRFPVTLASLIAYESQSSSPSSGRQAPGPWKASSRREVCSSSRSPADRRLFDRRWMGLAWRSRRCGGCADRVGFARSSGSGRVGAARSRRRHLGPQKRSAHAGRLFRAQWFAIISYGATRSCGPTGAQSDVTPFSQEAWACRCEWGPNAVLALAPADVTVIVDVFSFTTCVDVATSRGAVILPYSWNDASAAEFGRGQRAELAGKRRHTKYSLARVYLDAPARLRCVPLANGEQTRSRRRARLRSCWRSLQSARCRAAEPRWTHFKSNPAGTSAAHGSVGPARDWFARRHPAWLRTSFRKPSPIAVFARIARRCGALDQLGPGRELGGSGHHEDTPRGQLDAFVSSGSTASSLSPPESARAGAIRSVDHVTVRARTSPRITNETFRTRALVIIGMWSLASFVSWAD